MLLCLVAPRRRQLLWGPQQPGLRVLPPLSAPAECLVQPGPASRSSVAEVISNSSAAIVVYGNYFSKYFEVHYIVFSSRNSSLFWCSKAADMSVNLPNTSLPHLPLPFLGQSDRRKKFPRVTSHKVSNNVFPWFNLSLRSHLYILPFSPPFPLSPPCSRVKQLVVTCKLRLSPPPPTTVSAAAAGVKLLTSFFFFFLYNRTNGSPFGSIPLLLNGLWMRLRLTY